MSEVNASRRLKQATPHRAEKKRKSMKAMSCSVILSYVKFLEYLTGFAMQIKSELSERQKGELKPCTFMVLELPINEVPCHRA